MISLFASSVRPHYWQPFFDSLRGNKVPYEVVLSGPIEETVTQTVLENYPEVRYIITGDIKPAQCYEIARRHCKGELVGWVSDDCEFEPGALDKIWEFYKNLPPKVIIALKNTDAECTNNELNDQRFFPRNLNTPQMAIIGFMNREYLESLGGIDRRYVIGKWESDICMRVYADGGLVLKFEDTYVKIEHTSKNGMYNNDWSGDNEDGYTLENAWVIGGYKDFEKTMHGLTKGGQFFSYSPISNREVTIKRFDKFEPYEEADLLTKSQSHKNNWQ